MSENLNQVYSTSTPAPKTHIGVRVGAELVGTYFVCVILFIVGTLGQVLYGANTLLIAVATAAAYGIVSAILGKLSGAHYNPAVTVAALFTAKITWLDALLYVIAQLIGAIAAAATVVGILPSSTSIPDKTWLTYVVNGFDKGSASNSILAQTEISFNITMAIVVELIASIVVIAAAIRTLRVDGEPKPNHSLVMGIAYGIGAAVTFPITGAGMNPARSTGIALIAQNKGLTQYPLQQLWIFWVCPLLAAAIVSLVVILLNMLKIAQTSKAISEETTADEAVALDDTDDTDDADDYADAEAADEETSAPEESEQKPDTEESGEETNSPEDADEGVKSN
ncbi:MAG: aquaporin [Bifidobacterium aquikefiri]|uniref:Major intrinsic protein n=1 Tax=Bifidobacterium aquikefiri TaxID=1653207 RepID=A0A261G7I3_9BIFI|nr:aquaporin [Bifidobacterium aquikefiri]OZG66976.1 major intrinsic protein [Bifidobacterium aquikefiri]